MSQWSELVRANTHIYSKNLMGVEDIRDYFKDYLLERIRLFSRFSYPYSGVFRFGGITSDLTNAISVLAGVGIDNNGNLVYWGNYQNMPIPIGQTLYYGVKYSELAGDVEFNPKTGSVEYARKYEVIGDIGKPDSVTDNGNGTLTLNVNTLLHSIPSTGRVVRVMLNQPQSITEWYYDALVESGNTITISSYLGQVSPSTNANDYIVWVLGATVVTNKSDLTPSHIYLGYTTQVDTNKPPVWNKDGIIWLQAVTDHHTANLPSEIKYPHKLEKLDKYYYPQDNLVYNSYFSSGTPPTLNGWTLSATTATLTVDSNFGDYGFTACKFTSTSSGGSATITANTTTNNNYIKVGKNTDVSFQIKCCLASGSMNNTNSSIKLSIDVFERDGSTPIETIDLTNDKIKLLGSWVLIFYNGWKNKYNRSVVIRPKVSITSDAEEMTLYISSIKVEFGSSITIYTPHPSEINGAFGSGTSSTITSCSTTKTSTTTTGSSWTTVTTSGSTSGTTSGTTTSQTPTTEPATGTQTSTTITTTTTSGGSSGCVIGNTEITMADGTVKPISSILVGDKVKCFDRNCNPTEGVVSKVFRHKGSYKVMTVDIGGNLLTITSDHKVSVKTADGLISYSSIKKVINDNDTVFCPNLNKWSNVVKVDETLIEDVYNITVGKYHCYIANGILISNSKQQEGSPTLL